MSPLKISVFDRDGHLLLEVAESCSAGDVTELVGAAGVTFSNKFGPWAWVVTR